MRVFVQAQGQLKHRRPGPFTLELPAGATVRMMVEATGIPWDEVGLVAVNGRQAPDEAVLRDGDRIMLMAPMEGG